MNTRLLAAAGLLAGLLLGAGCTVQPLYGEITSATGVSPAEMSELLSSVHVKEARSLYDDQLVAQEVRNQLIFLLGRGAGQPATPRYDLDMEVIVSDASAASVQRQIDRDDRGQPTASVATVRVNFELTDLESDERLADGTRLATASYDLSSQEFAALRASRDATNRAAREVAELLRMAVVQAIVRPKSDEDDEDEETRVISSESQIDGFGPDGEIETRLEQRD